MSPRRRLLIYTLHGTDTSTSVKPTFGGFTTPNPQQGQGQQGQGQSSLFGQTPQIPTQNAPGSSLFGNNAQQPQQQQQSTGGLFGSTNQQKGGGLFGSLNQPQPQQSQQQQQPGGLFGSTMYQPQPAQSSLFASSTQKPRSSLFGSTTQSGHQPGGGASLFGQQSGGVGGSALFGQSQQNNQNAQQGTSLFGSSSLFSQPQQQQQPMQQCVIFPTSQAQANVFRFNPQQQQQTQPQMGLFASTSANPKSSLFASTSNSNPLAASGFGSIKREPDIETRMMGVKNAWDVNSPECKFKVGLCIWAV